MEQFLQEMGELLPFMQEPRFGIPLPVLYLIIMIGVILWGGSLRGTDLPAGGPGGGGLEHLGVAGLADHPAAAADPDYRLGCPGPPALVRLLSLHGAAGFSGGLDQLCQQPETGRQGSSPLAPGPAAC